MKLISFSDWGQTPFKTWRKEVGEICPIPGDGQRIVYDIFMQLLSEFLFVSDFVTRG